MSTAPDSTPSRVGSSRPEGPWHEALAYPSPGALGTLLAEPVGAAVAAGDLVTAVLEQEAGRRLRDELGAAAAGVEFLDPGRVHTVPGFTTAVRWARDCGRVAGSGARVLIVGQQLLELPGCGNGYWARLCLGLEVAAAGQPLTVLCPFRDEDAEWARVRNTHPTLGTPSGSGPNPAYRPPRDVLPDYPPPARRELGPPAAELAFRATDLSELRHLTAELGTRAGLASDRVADVVLAINELATNSIEHGPGSGRLRLWTDAGPGLMAEVAEGGRMTEPFPGMVHPAISGPRGRGLWLVSELSDVLEVWTGDDTVIRVSWLG